MKNKILVLVGIAGVLIATDITAQQDNKPATPQAPPVPAVNAGQTVVPRDRAESIARYLNLTDEQKEKVKPIIDDETKKIQELRQQKDLSPQERNAKLREIREATYQKMKPILTEEQWKKFYRPLTTVTTPQGDVPQKPQTPPVKGNEKQSEKK